jgi:hypothetical protein
MSACAPCDEDDTTNNGDNGAETGAAATETVEVGIIYSETGPLAAYEAQYRGGLEAGIDYATEGTVEVHGTTIELLYRDDTGNQDTALSTARDLIGQDYQILVGTVVSGIAVALAEQAEQNGVLYISGPAAADAVTGSTTTPSAPVGRACRTWPPQGPSWKARTSRCRDGRTRSGSGRGRRPLDGSIRGPGAGRPAPRAGRFPRPGRWRYAVAAAGGSQSRRARPGDPRAHG